MTDVCAPTPLGLEPSFGFGDRLGLATLGHIDAIRGHGGPILPIFAQQSSCEMERTRRKPIDVLNDAVQALRSASYSGVWGADADHLKTPEDVNAAVSAGFVFFTLDPSDYIDARADDLDAATLERRYHEVRDDGHWADHYFGRTIRLTEGVTIEFPPDVVRRVAVKYGRAIAHAVKLAAHIDRTVDRRNAVYEIELSLNESPRPTTLAEHFMIAEQCLQSTMKLVSVAPRFLGDFEKGIDFQGDRAALARSLAEHAAIAHTLGPYKLSLHSGSDKLSIYELFARVTGGRFHVKTAGTSYLEALRVAARHERKLFRRIVEFSRQRFEKDSAACRVSGRLENVPTPAAVGDDAKLEEYYLDRNDGRQILHVTYGSVLTDSALGPALRDVLVAEPETHRSVLARHFGKHLKALCRGL